MLPSSHPSSHVMVLRPRGHDYDVPRGSSHLRGYKAVVHDALLVWTKDSMLFSLMIISLVHVIIVTVTVMFRAYLIVCTVRSLRVTVTINKVLSYLILLSGVVAEAMT